MKKFLTLALAVFALGTFAFAGDEAKEEEKSEMPPMGAPEEMKHLAFLVGNWAVNGKLLDQQTGEWVDHTAKSSFAYIADGCSLESDYHSNMMGMEFIGKGFRTWDREAGMWQLAWIDNMGARISLFSGQTTDGVTVFEGEDIQGGKTVKSRITTFEVTDTSYKWKMEQSMDGGQTWVMGMEATYTKE